ncbi:flagellar export chaperone FlgN [Megalodesulfovibrio gigas]|uniref:Putative FlgN family protein n=1 Tax=Megalodesulfovibrio gigas (strain ATCC 19364 / DSM 1382 / NCIMB 9332 / VKM B-1759) TaxID=1121448 RepID=T2G8F4_MEGG1|nr:flagellar export chaperone FlgN [Megalodesulfovibrio gigas]AGW12426.1 putative FlgN family protein [Megalodesulfovibrio gigas DSM 1382 = ATCC 19364]
MHRALIERLLRQWKALLVLDHLQQEEFSLLAERQPQAVATIEFSIHELMRQIVDERHAVRAMLQGRRLRALMADLPPELGARTLLSDFDHIQGLPVFAPEVALVEVYETLLKLVDDAEQHCARQAEKNTALALGLYDQSKSLLDFMHKEIQPENGEVYSRKGAMRKSRGAAALVQGRL